MPHRKDQKTAISQRFAGLPRALGIIKRY